MSCNETKNEANDQMYRRFMFLKKIPPGDRLPLSGIINMYTYESYFVTFVSLKPLEQPKPNFIWSLLGKGGGGS